MTCELAPDTRQNSRTYTLFVPVTLVADQDFTCTIVCVLLDVFVPIADICGGGV